MLSVNNKTRQKAPQVPFSDIADRVLGSKYDLSLVFVGDTTSRRLNKQFRNKDKVANILSFPYDKKSGEIFLNLTRTKREAPKFSHCYAEHVVFLFIHGCLHLEGLDHGAKMESEEQKYLRAFQTK